MQIPAMISCRSVERSREQPLCHCHSELVSGQANSAQAQDEECCITGLTWDSPSVPAKVGVPILLSKRDLDRNLNAHPTYGVEPLV